MYTIDKEKKWLVFTDGLDIIHGPIENTSDSVTQSNQPFVVYGDDKETVIDLIFEEYEINEEDKTEIKTLKEVKWITNYTLEEANYVKGAYNTNSLNSKLEPIKHPDKDEYAIPWIVSVFATFPEGDVKDSMTSTITEKENQGYILTFMEMSEEEWF